VFNFARYGCDQTLKWLVRADMLTTHGFSEPGLGMVALRIAAGKGHVHVVRYLLSSHNVDPNFVVDQPPALYAAAKKGTLSSFHRAQRHDMPLMPVMCDCVRVGVRACDRSIGCHSRASQSRSRPGVGRCASARWRMRVCLCHCAPSRSVRANHVIRRMQRMLVRAQSGSFLRRSTNSRLFSALDCRYRWPAAGGLALWA
jgi:hypothetical protein